MGESSEGCTADVFVLVRLLGAMTVSFLVMDLLERGTRKKGQLTDSLELVRKHWICIANI